MLSTYELGIQWIPDDELLVAAKQALPPISGSWKGLLGSGSVGPEGFRACQRGGWREVESSFGRNSGYIAFVEGGEETFVAPTSSAMSPPPTAESAMTEGYANRASTANSHPVRGRGALDFFDTNGGSGGGGGGGGSRGLSSRASSRAMVMAAADTELSPTDRHDGLRSAVESSDTAAILAAHGA